MIPFGLKLYMGTYLALSLCAVLALLARRRSLVLFRADYWRFLLVPWKLATFVVGGLAITLPAPYLGYSSWDMPIGAGQSTLAFLLAPWSVGVLARCARRRALTLEAWLAVWAMFVTGCWSVEVYLVLRDGAMMPEWLPNLLYSPCCYVAVGLLWNVERRPDGDYAFAFARPSWPQPADAAPPVEAPHGT